MYRLSNERFKCQRNRKYKRGFGAPRRGLENLGVIWSNKRTLLYHLIKGWAKKDFVAPRAFLLVPIICVGLHGESLLHHDEALLRQVGSCCAKHGLIMPCIILFHQDGDVAPT